MAVHEHLCRDPRDAEGEALLLVSFDISRFATAPHGYGEHFDPGSGDEFDIVAVVDGNSQAGIDVLPDLTPEQVETLEAAITENFDFRRARDAERWDPREDI